MALLKSSLRQHQRGAAFATFIGRGLVLVLLVLVALLLSYQYWYGVNGRKNLDTIEQALATQQAINQSQRQKNARLVADIKDLKQGLGATEEHARSELGLIKSGEVFVQISVAPVTTRHALAVDENEPDAVEILDVMTEVGQ